MAGGIRREETLRPSLWPRGAGAGPRPAAAERLTADEAGCGVDAGGYRSLDGEGVPALELSVACFLIYRLLQTGAALAREHGGSYSGQRGGTA